MAWSDAARKAAAEARRRKALLNAKNRLQAKAMAAFAPSAKMTPESAVRAFAPEVRRQMVGSRAYRLIDPGFAATMHPGQRALSGLPKMNGGRPIVGVRTDAKGRSLVMGEDGVWRSSKDVARKIVAGWRKKRK
jgi:hypothetical protein